MESLFFRLRNISNDAVIHGFILSVPPVRDRRVPVRFVSLLSCNISSYPGANLFNPVPETGNSLKSLKLFFNPPTKKSELRKTSPQLREFQFDARADADIGDFST